MKKFLSLLTLSLFLSTQCFGMDTPVLSGTNLSPSNAGTQYMSIINAGVGSTSTERDRTVVAPISGVLRSLRFRLDTAPGATRSWAMTIRVNEVSTAITCTIADTATSGSDMTNWVFVKAGDRITLEVAPTNTPTSSQFHYSILFTAGANQSPIFGTSGANTPNNGAARFAGPQGMLASFGTTVAVRDQLCSVGGTITNLYIDLTSAPGAGTSLAFVLMVNDVASALTCTVSGTSTQANDNLHSVTIVPGDRLCLRVTPAGTPAVSTLGWGMLMQPTIDGESPQMLGSSNAPNNAANNFNHPHSGATWNATENVRDVIVTACTIKNMYTFLGTAPGALSNFAFTIRINGASQTVSNVVADLNTTSSDTTNTVLATTDQKLGIISVPTTAPLTGNTYIGFTTYIQPSNPANFLEVYE